MKASCVVLLPTRVFGGHERMLVQWLRQAAADGLQARIHSAPDESLARECGSAGLAPPVVSYPSRAGRIRDFIVTWRLLGSIPPEVPILLAPGVLQVALQHWLAAFLRRRKVVGYVPMMFSSRQMGFRGGALRDWVVGHVIRRVHLWITISKQQRDLLVERWRVRRPVHVVPNRMALLGQAVPPGPGRIEGPLRVLFAGRFDANQKGLDWLCDRLRERRDEWAGRLRFTFKGQGPFQAELARLADELGPAHVELQPWGEVGRAMGEADVLLLPSRFEGVPLVALEATHYGLPVVASTHAGVSEFVPRGCLFEFGNDRAMWDALERMREPAQREAARAYSRVHMQRMLSPESFRRSLHRLVAALESMGAAAPRTSW